MLFTWLTDSRFLDWSLSSILVATVAIGGGLYAIQTRLIYMPYFPQDSRTNVYKPSQFGMPSFEEFFIKAADGCLLHLYFIPASFNSQVCPTLIFFHVSLSFFDFKIALSDLSISQIQTPIIV